MPRHRLSLKRALLEIGLPGNFSVRSQEAYDEAMERWKKLVVAARRSNCDDRAAFLSQCKSVIKKRHESAKSRICPRCGEGKSQEAEHCNVCYRILFYSDAIDYTEPTMHEIESSLILVPDVARRRGALTEALLKLAKGKIGDSFVSDKTASSITLAAKMQGGQVICRIANPEEKDPKKRKYRVWRSDGLSMEEVNTIIRKRMEGQPVPESKEWVPMKTEEARNIKGRTPKK